MFSVVFISVTFFILILWFCVIMRNRCREIEGNQDAIGHLVLSVPENAVTIDVIVENS